MPIPFFSQLATIMGVSTAKIRRVVSCDHLMSIIHFSDKLVKIGFRSNLSGLHITLAYSFCAKNNSSLYYRQTTKWFYLNFSIVVVDDILMCYHYHLFDCQNFNSNYLKIKNKNDLLHIYEPWPSPSFPLSRIKTQGRLSYPWSWAQTTRVLGKCLILAYTCHVMWVVILLGTIICH